ncbi:SPOR domain-containing protein [Shimia marina]|uniref:Sporulation related domain protein n=1 Tax=Shimia marina TaxID=321267 RepID=A0A0P1EUA6_9RHOB|nr:SPOR domain-containing protein [Shimia marina]CUH54163.1 Sporulation related domain protein [Shimia marina]SFD96887.1 Sporulation related domain-containing protein [Shimia marina]
MKLSRFLAIGVIAASTGLGVAHAQSINARQTPAEFPPASFKGKQFVDSRGCVYIRAGVDGATTWVPRVTRDRKVICGFKPTFDAAARTAPAAAPKRDKNVVQIQPAASESTAAAATSAPAPQKTQPKTVKKTSAPTAKKVATPAAATAPVVTTAALKPPKKVVKQKRGEPLYTTPTAVRPTTNAKVIAPAAAPVAAPTTTTPVKTAPKAAVAPTATKPRRTSTQAPRASGIVSPCREGITTYKGSPVRCGPQAQSPVTPGTGRPTATPPQMRFDKNSSLRRPAVGTVVKVSELAEVAPDVRVVPLHVYENNLTNQVDSRVREGYRRAFEDGRLSETRAQMTVAGIAQTEAIWTNTVPRRLIQRTVDDAASPVARAATSDDVIAPTAVATKSEPVTKSLRLAGTPYVQVGTFGDAAQAQAAAKKIRRMGLPVRIGKYSQNGATQRIVLAGPFAAEDNASAALSKARGAGFGGAFLRQ